MEVRYVPSPSAPAVSYRDVEAQKAALQCGASGFEGLWHYSALLRALMISWTHRSLLCSNDPQLRRVLAAAGGAPLPAGESGGDVALLLRCLLCARVEQRACKAKVSAGSQNCWLLQTPVEVKDQTSLQLAPCRDVQLSL